MMRYYLILIPILIFSLIQGAFLPVNLVLLTVLAAAAAGSWQQGWLTAFFGGLFLDLAQGRSLGFSSLFFLLASLLLVLYRRKFDSFHPLFLAIFVFLSALVYSWLSDRVFSWQQALFLAILIFSARGLINYFQENRRGEIRLKTPF